MVLYFAFIYFTLDLITFINLVILSYLNYVSEYYLLTTHTYGSIYEIELRPSLSIPVKHKGYEVKICFSSQNTF